jgi:gamma-D-glutamyl-L-lysine dipeptidyl-peptidase
METYICENVFVPLRSAPTHKSEMLSQILFGEKYTILDKSGRWLKIKTLFDNYSGWIDIDHLQFSLAQRNSSGQVLNRSLVCFKNDKTKMVLEAGCEVFDPDFHDKIFTIGKNVYTASPDFNNNYISGNGSPADAAMKFINSPYIWGGRIPSGIDCSGFTQLAFKICNIPIARNAADQAAEGKRIDFIDEAIPGDLAFFGSTRGSITHVGMIISKGLIIHASGRVRIDTVDHQGIFKNEINGYSHTLRTIRRIMVNSDERS